MNIYFSGVGGVGIGPLVHIALDAGYGVQGSDAVESSLTRELESRGVKLTIGQDGSFLQKCHSIKPLDWFVYTSALAEDHPELVLARKLGIKVAKRDELLAKIIEEKHLKLIAVAGTHGKTTTTGMIVWTFKQLGIPVSYSVGTTLSFGPSGKFDPLSEYFIYECDEFDRNFLNFTPDLALITSVDYDHPDTYPTEKKYLDAFNEFITQCKQIILWRDDADRLIVSNDNSWILGDDEVSPIGIAGLHNRRNATLVFKTLEALKIDSSTSIIDILERFPGTSRRFERLDANLYTDYGHHPVEIAATLQLARELSDNVVLVYQPHQNVRQHEMRDQYANIFTPAEHIYWLPTYLARERADQEILSPEDLIEDITNKEDISIVKLDSELWQTIQKARKDNKLVLCMGAGTIDAWLRDQLNA